MEEFYIGQIFIASYPPESAIWCNEQRNCFIKEIELTKDNERQFQIVEIPPLTPEEEQERISKLKITKRVFALALQQMGISYIQLKELIATNEQAQLEWDLCVELERSNPLLDTMAAQMNITSEQIDYIFIEANKVNK